MKRSSPEWWVGFDNERVGRFETEAAALEFAHIDGQLERVSAVVTRVDPDGTMTIIAEFGVES